MLASNLLVRLSLLVVLCLGAFYYLVTVMDQQQQQIAGGPSGTAGSNWLADNGTTPNARPRRATSIRGSAIPIRDMPTSTSARSGIDAIVSNWANEVSGIITADSGTSSLVSIATTGHESEGMVDALPYSWTMTTTLASDIIYALIRSTNAAMFLTCDSERPCSAPTAPTIPQITLFKPHQQHDQEPGEKKKGIASNFEHSQLQEHKRDKGFGDNNSNRQDNKGKMKARLEEGEENQSLIVPTFDHQALRGFQYRIRSYPQSESAGESSRSSSRRPSVAYPATLPIALTTRGLSPWHRKAVLSETRKSKAPT
ncbi:hypothetical protein BC939DRAFT_475020 [Gamsiella multidivaricata]|uniref:uncharacterized protein n=1 Tax=Gamsiella multidivaricata TaxID=101098 RepID=UPI00222105D8|nr:uncharacterized protein BC939DRAFT_475020 [Gamsiella multidivaricata]KAI7827975.1 hypothetical protein BC939DRAFT_475020 [Gamsiella multidivaricata]